MATNELITKLKSYTRTLQVKTVLSNVFVTGGNGVNGQGLVNVNVSDSTITLDDAGFFDVVFQSNGNITGNKTIAFTDTNSKKKSFILSVIGGTYVLTWPYSVRFPISTYGWDDTAKTLQLDAGDYTISFIYDSLTSLWKGTLINY